MARKPIVPTRENRLNAIGAYLGDIGSLIAEFDAGEPPQRIRTFSQSGPDDIVQAMRLVGGIQGAGIVVHGGRGCAAAQIFAPPGARSAVTSLNQRDTIMGSDAIPAETIRALYRRHRPWVVFIVGTPVVTINNDDSRSVADELTDELGIPILVVRSDGFRSRIAATGFDTAARAVLQLIGPAEAGRRADLVNVVAVGAGPAARAHLSELLAGLGLQANLLPAGAEARRFSLAAQAALTVAVEPDAGEIIGQGLEDAHGVPFSRVSPPIGLDATRRWLEAIADSIGKPDLAEGLHTARAHDLSALVDSRPLDGKRVHLALEPADALGAADLIGELGGQVVGLTLDHVDTTHIPALRSLADRQPGVQIHVASGQPFEEASLLKALAPDLYMGTPDRAVSAARAGVSVVCVHPGDLLAYRGAAWLARQARKALANRAFVRRISETSPPPYREAWFKRSPDWHIKREVR